MWRKACFVGVIGWYKIDLNWWNQLSGNGDKVVKQVSLDDTLEPLENELLYAEKLYEIIKA
ncbi:hypothetical protein GCM10028791_13600 [Echinicola sediminis]